EIDEEAVGVVEDEHLLAAQALLAALDERLEALESLLVGAEEAFLLARQDAEHAALGGRELGIVAAELLDHLGGRVGEERLLETQHASLARRAAHEAAQYVTATFVAGREALGEGKGERPRVIGHDAQRHGARVFGIAETRQLLEARALREELDHGQEEIGLEDRTLV